MPILYIFADVNGAGKSTLTQSQFNKVIMYKVNADEISRRNGWDWHDDSKNLSAM
ncbi:ATPase [Lactobacillus helveticus]|uniref:ATPase n=1 Tax=Lactobacillus helveticus TaxID=1587 RepID=UPI001C652143|nr:ATPase [Lactobacillus helveticus]